MDKWQEIVLFYAGLLAWTFLMASARLWRNGSYRGIGHWLASAVVISGLVTAGVALAYADVVLLDIAPAIRAGGYATICALSGNVVVKAADPIVQVIWRRLLNQPEGKDKQG